MKIGIVSDAWHPQTNGVVKTLTMTVEVLQRMGHEVLVCEPGAFRTVPCPTYPEIQLALLPYRALARRLERFAPDAVHIATEGPLGTAARRWCLRRRMPFTTSYHTQFPEYLRARLPIPTRLTYAHLRRFHGAAVRTMVATETMQRRLETRGFTHLARWSRGVDLTLFKPREREFLSFPRPVWIYMGRVAVEKSIEDFLALELPGTKVIVGDGPARAELEKKYPAAIFTGYKFGEDLAKHVAAADVFVFPSKTDTFGLVLLEAMACGVPIAAYPVTGPIDVIKSGVTGVLDADLRTAALGALKLSREVCREQALAFTWEAATRQFLHNLAPLTARAAVEIRVSSKDQDAELTVYRNEVRGTERLLDA